MQLEFFSTWTQGKGNCPLPLQPIPKNNTNNRTNINPKNNTNINNKTEAVYTEGLTHPAPVLDSTRRYTQNPLMSAIA
jgi:hypothetical protein